MATKYEQSQAERRVSAYTNPANEDLMARQNRKTFMTAAYYLGTAIGLFFLVLILPDIEGTLRDVRVLGVFKQLGWALVSASAVLLIALMFARGLSTMLMVSLNWFILPAVLIDGLMTLADVFLEPEVLS